MKGIVLLVVGVILLLAAAGGGYFAYTKFMAPKDEAAEAKKAKPPPEPPAIYVRIPPLEVPVVGAERVEQLITFVVALRVKDQAAGDTVGSRVPRIVDTFLTTLYGAIDEGEVLNGTIVNIAGVKKKLQAASDQLFGKDTVQEVLVQTVLQRRL